MRRLLLVLLALTAAVIAFSVTAPVTSATARGARPAAPPATSAAPSSSSSATSSSSTTTTITTEPPVAAPKLRGVGDSVFRSAIPSMLTVLQPEYRPRLVGVEAASMQSMIPTTRVMVDAGPPVMVIGLANPDVRLMVDPVVGYLPYVWAEDLLDVTAGVPCVVWMNLKEHGVYPLYATGWEREATKFNTWLEGAAAPGGRLHFANLHVIDWNAASAGHPDWFVADGLHLTPTGQANYARKVDRTLERRCPP